MKKIYKMIMWACLCMCLLACSKKETEDKEIIKDIIEEDIIIDHSEKEFETQNDAVKLEYEMAYPVSEGLMCVLVNGKFGFVDENGIEVIPCIYDDAAPFSNGLAYFATEDKYGFLNLDGSEVFLLECDSVSSFSEGLAYYSIDGKYGYINTAGKPVIEACYSDADFFINGIAFVEIDGNKGAIAPNGEVVISIEYKSLERTDRYIYAQRNSDIYEGDYFDFEGNPISKEEVPLLNNSEDETDDTRLLLNNHITPRKKLYWNLLFTNDSSVIGTDGSVNTVREFATYTDDTIVKTAKLYDINSSGNPYLFLLERPKTQYVFPLSESSLYAIYDEQLYVLARGSECGGSLRGDIVHFYKDPLEGEILFGLKGQVGGLGGTSIFYDKLYCEKDGIVNTVTTFEKTIYMTEDNNSVEFTIDETNVSEQLYEELYGAYESYTLFYE